MRSRSSRSRRTRSTPRCAPPAAGVLTEILVPEGETVEVGVRLAVIGDGPGGGVGRQTYRAGGHRACRRPQRGPVHERGRPQRLPPPEPAGGPSAASSASAPATTRAPPHPRPAPAPSHGEPTGPTSCRRLCAASSPRTGSANPRSRPQAPVGGSPAMTCPGGRRSRAPAPPPALTAAPTR